MIFQIFQGGAVRSLSSLPVNYSLLSICEADSTPENKKPESKNNPTRNIQVNSSQTSYTSSSSTSRPCSSRQFNTHERDKPANNSNFSIDFNDRQNLFQRSMGRINEPSNWMTCGHASSTHNQSNSRSLERNKNKNNFENLLQEELDFQMAVHLTFCKVRLFEFKFSNFY